MKPRWVAGEGQEGEVERAGVGASGSLGQGGEWWETGVGKTEASGFVRGRGRARKKETESYSVKGGAPRAVV